MIAIWFILQQARLNPLTSVNNPQLYCIIKLLSTAKMCHQAVRRSRGNLLTVTLNASEPVNPQQNPHSSEEALTCTDHHTAS